jgi:hypothetical protein
MLAAFFRVHRAPSEEQRHEAGMAPFFFIKPFPVMQPIYFSINPAGIGTKQRYEQVPQKLLHNFGDMLHHSHIHKIAMAFKADAHEGNRSNFELIGRCVTLLLRWDLHEISARGGSPVSLGSDRLSFLKKTTLLKAGLFSSLRLYRTICSSFDRY